MKNSGISLTELATGNRQKPAGQSKFLAMFARFGVKHCGYDKPGIPDPNASHLREFGAVNKLDPASAATLVVSSTWTAALANERCWPRMTNRWRRRLANMDVGTAHFLCHMVAR
ncbi:hypothetical protein Poly51_31840 [Rubripirellula tenax]|uniref:Uncharacterized protein n=1 Tax=Rubripirellula tenax TaxID=2528015 RepID=A0A5C6F090_9BACT|nr:hypothetical protein Poly51_31840 [Rubripirellula tenax]